MRKLSDKEIEQYVASGEPMHGAGAYVMQGSGHALMARIEGDYNNIIGLPLNTILKALKRFGAL
jgi:septum formation protein